MVPPVGPSRAPVSEWVDDQCDGRRWDLEVRRSSGCDLFQPRLRLAFADASHGRYCLQLRTPGPRLPALPLVYAEARDANELSEVCRRKTELLALRREPSRTEPQLPAITVNSFPGLSSARRRFYSSFELALQVGVPAFQSCNLAPVGCRGLLQSIQIVPQLLSCDTSDFGFERSCKVWHRWWRTSRWKANTTLGSPAAAWASCICAARVEALRALLQNELDGLPPVKAHGGRRRMLRQGRLWRTRGAGQR